jgi:hypothetical protein
MIPAEVIYIAHLLLVWAIRPTRIPYLRIYVGSYLSIVGLSSMLGGYFPPTFSQLLLKFIQAFALVDMLNSRSPAEIIQHIAVLYISRALDGAPDLQHIPTLCIVAVAPTYYIAGEIWPAIFNGRFYALLLIACSILPPLYTAATLSMSSYVAGIYMMSCTYGAYSLGVYVNSHP